MAVFNNALAGAAGAGGDAGYKIERSVRLDSNSSSYLSRTPSSPGNRRKWTWSGWIKKTINNSSTSSSGRYFIFNADTSSQNSTIEYKSDAISVFDYNNGAYQWQLVTAAVFRDNSSWFHLVVSVDTTQATASNRVKIYINGVQQTSFSTSNYPSQNYQSKFNAELEHRIGALNNNSFFLDSYLAEVHFIDGQALAASDFGEPDAVTGVWNPIKYTHSDTVDYSGNNQITIDPGNYYLNGLDGPNAFNGDGFTYIDSRLGTGSNNTTNIIWQPTGGIENVTKIRVHTNYATHYRINNGTWTSFSSTGTYAQIYSGTAFTLTKLEIRRDNCQASDWGHRVTFYEINDVEYQNVGINSFHLDFSDNSSAGALGDDRNDPSYSKLGGATTTTSGPGTFYYGYSSNRLFDGNIATYLYGGWAQVGDASNIIWSPPSGSYSVSSSLRVYAGYFSTIYVNGVSKATGNGNNAESWVTLAHTGAITEIKMENTANDNVSRISAIEVDGTILTSKAWTPNNLVSSAILSNVTQTVTISGNTNSGRGPYSKTAPKPTAGDAITDPEYSGSLQSGNNSGDAVTVSFNPAFTGVIYAGNSGGGVVSINGGTEFTPQSNVSYALNPIAVTNCTSFYSKTTATGQRGWISVAFRDDGTQVYNSSDVLVNVDDLLDSPTNYEADSGNNGGNYATLNPLQTGSGLSLSNGNLDLDGTSSWKSSYSSIFLSSGKWYTEYAIRSITSHSYGILVGLAGLGTNTIESEIGSSGDSYAIQNGPGDMKVNYNGTSSGQGPQAAYAVGDVLQLAWDADNGKLFFGKNGSWINSGNPVTGANAVRTNLTGTYCFAVALLTTSDKISANFGQLPFTYTPPTGFKSLCTQNLDDPLIADPSKYFDIATYSGTNQSPRTVTGLNIAEPDFVWVKNRNDSSPNLLWDAVRGTDNNLRADTADTESAVSGSSNGIISTSAANGFVVKNGSSSGTNVGSSGTDPIVAWAWDAGSSNTQISAGSLNSSVYNSSQTWSNGWSGDINSSYPGTRSFDGDISTGGVVNTSGTATWTAPGSGIAISSSLRVYGRLETSDGGFTINFSDSSTSTIPVNATKQWHTISGAAGKTITSIVVSKAANGYEGIFHAVEIDGKILLDNGVTPVDSFPSLASTVRANPTAGFSIVSFTADGTAGDTVGHGLNAKPELIIYKDREYAQNWGLYHGSLGANYGFNWNRTDERFTDSGYFNNTEPTSLVATFGNYVGYFGTHGIIAYCFASVEGYSKIGSYTGNGSADGPFVYCGFKPRWIMMKNAVTGGQYYDWRIIDTARHTYNEGGDGDFPPTLFSNLPDAEKDWDNVDILSNGFKIKDSSVSLNQSGAKQIFIAFAEHPFKISRAR